ncbi:MAG: septum formation protein Maf [Candidatus Levybacteria bacterium]|nr:septum formation protein Maf [Candidatus Levybacteria bacterium]
MKTIVLASKSPRRKALLEKIGLKFIIYPSNYKEANISLPPEKYVKHLSLQKAKVVGKKFKNALIIAADTIVVIDSEIIGKPKDLEDAKRILKKLSGKMHFVYTGFTIFDTDSQRSKTKSSKSKVYFKNLSSREIESYVKSGKPFDKAGGYAIQEKAGIFIRKVEGDFFNIVGLPIYSLVNELKKFGFDII